MLNTKPIRSHYVEIINNAGIMASSTWIGRLIAFLTTVFVVRALGAELYGVYTLGKKIFDLIFIFSVFGLDLAMVKFISACRETGNQKALYESLYTTFVLGTALSTGMGIAVMLTSRLWENIFSIPQLGYVMFILGISIPFFVFLTLSSSYFRAEKRLSYSAYLISLLLPAVKMILVFGLLLAGLKLKALLYGILLSSIISSLVAVNMMKRKFGVNPGQSLKDFRKERALTIVRFSSVLTAAQFFGELMTKVDVYMIGYILLATDVGIYGVVLEIGLLFSTVLTAFNTIFAPIISGEWEKGEKDRIESLYKFESKMVLLLVFPLALFIFLYPDVILSLFGQDFEGGATALILITAGQLFNCAVGGAGYVLIMTGKQKIHLINSFIFLNLNIVLNLLLIKKYGITGAAAAASTSLVLVNLVRVVQIKHFYRFGFFQKSTAKPLAAGAIVYCLFKILAPHFPHWWFLIPAGLAFLFFYFGIVYLLGLEEEEKELLKVYGQKLNLKRRS